MLKVMVMVMVMVIGHLYNLIDDFTVADASVHDSQALEKLLAEGDPTTRVDSGCAGAPCEAVFDSKGMTAKVIERAYRNKPLTSRQRRSNRAKSRIRVRVEHVFGIKHERRSNIVFGGALEKQ